MEVDKKYSYNRFGTSGSRVGQAVVDILENSPPELRAEEVLEEMGKGVVAYLEEAVQEGYKKYKTTFYLLHLLKKELTYMGVENVLLQKATCFPERKWEPSEVHEAHPNHAKTLYKVDPQKGEMRLLWTVPGQEDCRSIIKSPHLYDPDLVAWVSAAEGLHLKSKSTK